MSDSRLSADTSVGSEGMSGEFVRQEAIEVNRTSTNDEAGSLVAPGGAATNLGRAGLDQQNTTGTTGREDDVSNNTDDQLRPGDRVYVDDEGLAMLRAVMEKHGEKPKPNHHGTIAEVWPAEEGKNEELTYLINFDDGGAAPYPASDTHPLVAGVSYGD